MEQIPSATRFQEMLPLPQRGRTWTAEQAVRLGDVTPRGRLRLDAAARYLQDVANDDAMEANLDGAMAWVVRRTTLHVHTFPTFRERLELTTFCSGTGSHWAERRTSMRTVEGGHLEAAAVWVHVNQTTGRPVKIGPGFEETYGEAAQGRRVRARLHHSDPTEAQISSSALFPLRFSDFDLLGHVNNAILLAIVEDQLAKRRELRAPLWAEVEYRATLQRDSVVAVAVAEEANSFRLWVLDRNAGAVVCSAAVGLLSAATL